MIHTLKLFYYRTFKNTEFIIAVRNSAVGFVSGIKHKRFITDCKDIVRENGLVNGIIYGVKNSDGITRLKTSGEVSKSVAQRLRNVWSFYG